MIQLPSNPRYSTIVKCIGHNTIANGTTAIISGSFRQYRFGHADVSDSHRGYAEAMESGYAKSRKRRWAKHDHGEWLRGQLHKGTGQGKAAGPAVGKEHATKDRPYIDSAELRSDGLIERE